MNNVNNTVEDIKKMFLEYTGLANVEIRTDQVGPETFMNFIVGLKAPLYSSIIGHINQQIPEENPFHGRITTTVKPPSRLLDALELELLRSLIQRSLTVSNERLSDPFRIKFAPFRGGEEVKVTLKANHVIWGRRGVGKSSLILMGVERLKNEGHVPIWLNLEPYGRQDGPRLTVALLIDSFQIVIESIEGKTSPALVQSLRKLLEDLRMITKSHLLKQEDLSTIILRCHETIKSITKVTGSKIFLFLDDAHLILPEYQPMVFHALLSVLRGAGGYIKIAGVKTLLRLYDPVDRIGLQIPHDIQSIELDLNLVNPSAARSHLESVLLQFTQACGFLKVENILASQALDRLVWCSAGVPRDFLWLFDNAVGHAKLERRKKVGVQDVNIAVGDFSQIKLAQVEQDSPQESQKIKSALGVLQAKCLDDFKTNAFLAKQSPNEEGYLVLKKISDLRLIHLLNASITPQKAGERYEAYLLDYSFYTGVRRRQRINELKIGVSGLPRYSELRKLPKIDPTILIV